MANDPIHQFQISKLIPIEIGGLDFSFTNSSAFMVATVVAASAFLFLTTSSRGLPESKLALAIVPHWAVALPLLAWSAWRVFGPAARRQRRVKRGQCVQCGYDLRASTGRCPECGAAIPATAL